MSTHFNSSYLLIRDLSGAPSPPPVVTNDHSHYQQQQEDLEHRYKVNSIIENLHAACDRTHSDDSSGTQTSAAMISLLPPGK